MGTMDGKIALVTGGTSGIGKATAIGLAKQGAAVTLLVRSAQRGEQAARDIAAAAPSAPKVELLECDLSSQASIRKAAATFMAKHEKLHVLVNAAGVFVKDRKLTVDGVETTFAVNYVAYFLLTNALLPSLKKAALAAPAGASGSSANAPAAPSRIVNVSSRYGGAKLDFSDLQLANKPYSYLKSTPQTMLARVMFTQELADRLKGTGVVVNTLHPGLVAKTQLLNDTGGVFKWLTDTFGGTPEKGADTAVWLATAPEAANVTGKMFAKRKEVKTPGQASDPAARTRLWDETAKLTKWT